MGQGQWSPACSQGSPFSIDLRPAHGAGQNRGYKGAASLLGCAADSRMVHGYTSQSVTQSRKASVNRSAINILGYPFVNEGTKLNAADKVYGRGFGPSPGSRCSTVAHTQSHTKGGRRSNAARKGIPTNPSTNARPGALGKQPARRSQQFID